MIASLRGLLLAVGRDHLVVETSGGIGFLVYVPRPLLNKAGSPGSDVTLHTTLVVREDSMTLYGFAHPDDRALFETLRSVGGVGPRVALNLLSFATPDEIRVAVAQKDTARFARVPGIGKKMAERLVLELQSKLDLKGIAPSAGVAPEATAETAALNTELLELLVSLGYSSAEANAAVAALPADAPPDIEARLRLALRYFGSA
jgi:Holliday junction DNA helicase RuvA